MVQDLNTLEGLEQTPLFVSGEGGYHTYRIPALLTTANGVLLAFCEARRHSQSDTGDIDLVLRRSRDNGLTWEPLRVIAGIGKHVYGNPCPVQDRSTGAIWLPFNWNRADGPEDQIMRGAAPREVWLMRSDDDGVTWGKPVEITPQVKRPEWTWYATGPGHGIQLRSGRLLIPCDHATGAPDRSRTHLRSHVIFSDDRGATWRIGGSAPGQTDECLAAELADGTVYLNMRSYHGKGRRAVARSSDGGQTWGKLTWDETLVEPVCQAGLLGLPDGRVLFSNPASASREGMMVRVSADGCRTWPHAWMIHRGPSAYSDLAVTADQQLCCLYERGERHPYETITLARCALAALVGRR